MTYVGSSGKLSVIAGASMPLDGDWNLPELGPVFLYQDTGKKRCFLAKFCVYVPLGVESFLQF